jgi:hypothetical protein
LGVVRPRQIPAAPLPGKIFANVTLLVTMSDD